jgi:hypothetical protein
VHTVHSVYVVPVSPYVATMSIFLALIRYESSLFVAR